MPRPKPVSPHAPLADRLIAGLSYPLRGTALATCVLLGLGQCLTILPGVIGIGLGFFLWLARWRYAAACLVHTANGFAEPPDVGMDENAAAGRALTLLHMLVVIACVACKLLYAPMFWPLVLFCSLILPAIDMSLAFGDEANAFNPLHWQRVIGRLGAGYFLPVVINLATGLLIMLPSLLRPSLLAILWQPLFAFGYTYLIIFNLHLMGVMIHRHHERFDLQPEAEVLARDSGQDDDERLLIAVRDMARVDRRAAIGMLVERMQGHSAPASLHQAYRELLKQEGLTAGLLEHGQIWIAALIANGEARRALGLVQECMDIDAHFLPDAPESVVTLAELASSSGMTRLSLKLCRGFLARWPRSAECPRLGLLAARQMAERLGQHAEAAVLLGKLAAAWTAHPLHPSLVAYASELQQRPGLSRTPALD
jgi:hypothetical protein